MTLSPDSIDPGGIAQLSWSTVYADSWELQPDTGTVAPNCKIEKILMTFEGQQTTLFSFLHYLPFGPPNLVQPYGGNIAVNIYDKEYRLAVSNVSQQTERHYHPGIGCFIGPDPIGLEGGINLYAYTFNDPVNLVNPTGQIGIAGIIIGAASSAFGGWRDF